jgi:hypothetical protein
MVVALAQHLEFQINEKEPFCPSQPGRSRWFSRRRAGDGSEHEPPSGFNLDQCLLVGWHH